MSLWGGGGGGGGWTHENMLGGGGWTRFLVSPKLGALIRVNSRTILDVKNFHVRRKAFPAVFIDIFFTSCTMK